MAPRVLFHHVRDIKLTFIFCEHMAVTKAVLCFVTYQSFQKNANVREHCSFTYCNYLLIIGYKYKN